MLGFLLTSQAYGQPVVVSGPLMAGDEPTGHLQQVELVARRWTSGTRFQFDLPVGGDDGKAALLHGTVDTRQQDSIVMGQVCSDVALSMVEKGSADFAVTMLAGAEAQLISHSKRGTVIRLPAPVPNEMEDERLLPTSALSASCPDVSGAEPRKPTNVTCAPFSFHSDPEEASSSFEIWAATRVTAKADKDGWHRVDYTDFNGFRWRGFTRGAPECNEEPPASEGLKHAGDSLGFRALPCHRALLPRGAVLRAADRETLLLSVRRDFEVVLCQTDRPFQWEVTLLAGSGEATVGGYFDGSPLPPPQRAGAR